MSHLHEKRWQALRAAQRRSGRKPVPSCEECLEDLPDPEERVQGLHQGEWICHACAERTSADFDPNSF